MAIVFHWKMVKSMAIFGTRTLERFYGLGAYLEVNYAAEFFLNYWARNDTNRNRMARFQKSKIPDV